MSHSYIRAELRRLVISRANDHCEYCLIAAEDTFLGCDIDHVISEKHGGETLDQNLALACVICNQAKGSDIGSLDRQTGEHIRFYNPRIDVWSTHFELEGERIRPVSAIGRVTSQILQFNIHSRLLERWLLIRRGKYPSAYARKLLQIRQP